MISLALKRCPPLICFQRNLMPFLLDYKSALIKREWISCDDISWLTQILMERIKWVWLIDSQAAKQSHHQSLLTHLLTRSLTRAIHQSTNQWIGPEIRYTHWISHLWPQGNWPADLCACYRKYDIYLSYTALLTQKNVRYIYYSQT